uniref:glutathione S-transferase A3-like n=1 Tax=Urocitellus parryii TaxID=9999 RepID=UPI000E55C349|nr:glutathione S-transferase A3-like [Urocitellus parryii]
MAGKPILHYFDGRARMESIRWLLAAAGVEFEEKFMKTRDDLEKLRKDGSLMFQQVPMVEIDGMKLVQTRAILNYIAAKYNLYGKDIKERALYGGKDLGYALSEKNQGREIMTSIRLGLSTNTGFLFIWVLTSHGQDYLVGNRLSKADVHLTELLYHTEELDSTVLANFPLLKALRTRVSNLPTVKKFLQPGSQRKPFDDRKCVEIARKLFS